MSTPAFLRVADADTGTVRLISLVWVATIDAGKQGPVLCLAVPDGAGGLVRVTVRGDLGELTRQLDGQADVSGLATLDAFVDDEGRKPGKKAAIVLPADQPVVPAPVQPTP